MNESCPTCEWWGYVTRMYAPCCHTCEIRTFVTTFRDRKKIVTNVCISLHVVTNVKWVMSHMRMSHVTRMYAPCCHTFEMRTFVTTFKKEIFRKCAPSRHVVPIAKCAILQVPLEARTKVKAQCMSYISTSHVPHLDLSCHTYRRVMSHMWMSRVAHLKVPLKAKTKVTERLSEVIVKVASDRCGSHVIENAYRAGNTCVYTYVYIYTCIYIYVYIFMFIYICVYIYVCGVEVTSSKTHTALVIRIIRHTYNNFAQEWRNNTWNATKSSCAGCLVV